MKRLRKIAIIATGLPGAIAVGALSTGVGVYAGRQEVVRIEQLVKDLEFSDAEIKALRDEREALIKEKKALGIDRTPEGMGPQSWGPRISDAVRRIITKHNWNVNEWIKHSEPFLDMKIETMERGKRVVDFQTYMMWYPIFMFGFIKASSGLALALGVPMWYAGRRLRRKERKEQAGREKMIFELFGSAAHIRVLFHKHVVQKQPLTLEEHETFLHAIERLLQIYKDAGTKFPEDLDKLPPELKRLLEAVPSAGQTGDKENKNG